VDYGIKIYLRILISLEKRGGAGGVERAWKEAMEEGFAAAARPYRDIRRTEISASEALPLALQRSAPTATAAAAAAAVAAAACCPC